MMVPRFGRTAWPVLGAAYLAASSGWAPRAAAEQLMLTGTLLPGQMFGQVVRRTFARDTDQVTLDGVVAASSDGRPVNSHVALAVLPGRGPWPGLVCQETGRDNTNQSFLELRKNSTEVVAGGFVVTRNQSGHFGEAGANHTLKSRGLWAIVAANCNSNASGEVLGLSGEVVFHSPKPGLGLVPPFEEGLLTECMGLLLAYLLLTCWAGFHYFSKSSNLDVATCVMAGLLSGLLAISVACMLQATKAQPLGSVGLSWLPFLMMFYDGSCVLATVMLAVIFLLFSNGVGMPQTDAAADSPFLFRFGVAGLLLNMAVGVPTTFLTDRWQIDFEIRYVVIASLPAIIMVLVLLAWFVHGMAGTMTVARGVDAGALNKYRQTVAVFCVSVVAAGMVFGLHLLDSADAGDGFQDGSAIFLYHRLVGHHAGRATHLAATAALAVIWKEEGSNNSYVVGATSSELEGIKAGNSASEVHSQLDMEDPDARPANGKMVEPDTVGCPGGLE